MSDNRHNLKPEELAVLEMDPFFSSDLTVNYRDHMGNDEAIVEAMLVSTTDAAFTEPDHEAYLASFPGRLNFMMKHKHGSPFEQAALQFYVKAPIMVFREWHRHRIGFSYNEASARYKVMKPEFYIPSKNRPLVQEGKHSSAEFVPGSDEDHSIMWLNMMQAYTTQWMAYTNMIEHGVAKEVARAVLGVGLYSEMIVTLNPRSCMAFLSLRQHHADAAFVSRPQWEINQCANQMEEVFANLFPITHKLYVENGRQAP